MATKGTYMLFHRDEEIQESELLERQYDLLKHAFSGQLLHPSIPPLGEHFAAADIGTGTGAWLNDLARSFPRPADSRINLVGFDISSHKYPSANEERVELVVHDVTRRFPTKYHGIFDVVHLRLLVYAIREEDVIRVVKNVTELLRPGGYLPWQDTDLNEIWSKPASPIISQTIRAVNLERIARELSLLYVHSMPETIVKALLTLQLPPRIPILELPNCSRSVLRILAIDTISTANVVLPPELEDPKQDLTFDVLLILLHAASRRKQSTVALQQKESDTQETEQGEDYGELEEQLKELRVEGSHRLNTKFTWVVAQKNTVSCRLNCLPAEKRF